MHAAPEAGSGAQPSATAEGANATGLSMSTMSREIVVARMEPGKQLSRAAIHYCRISLAFQADPNRTRASVRGVEAAFVSR